MSSVLARLASVGYGAGVRGREYLFKHGWLPSARLPRMTVCVGNITAGGTGKTPLVIRLAADLRGRGRKIAVLLRGYKRKEPSETPLIVRDAEKIYASVEAAGDEALELANRLPGVCVVVGADRFAAGQAILARGNVDGFIMDDGFQHYQLRRDLDIVTLDAMNPWGGRALLPAGLLREPPQALSRADAVVLTRAGSVASDRLRLLRAEVTALLRSEAPYLESRPEPRTLVSLSDASERRPQELAGKKILAVSAIGNPAAFEASLAQLGAQLEDALRLPDHSRRWEDVKAWADRRQKPDQWILTTEKDALRWRTEWARVGLRDVFALRISLAFTSSEAAWTSLLERIEKGIHEYSR